MEMVVAISILFIVMVSLSYMVTNGLTDVAFGKQRQVATSLMNRTMEEIRALPFAQVAAGLSDTDLAAPDPNIKKSGSPATYTFIPNGETIPHFASGSGQPPLVPHRSTTTINGIDYSIGAYPTYTFPAGVFRVTVIVSWNKTFETGVASKVSTQSLVYSPEGCLSRTTHPFGAPCQPFFYSNTDTGTGFLRITKNPAASGDAIFGIPLNQAEISLPSASSSIQVEQISTILGSLQSAGALLDVQGVDPQRSGGVTTSASADNDPGAGDGASDTENLLQTATQLVHNEGTGKASLAITPSSADTGTVTSTVVAAATPSCAALDGSTLATGQPCGSGEVRQIGTTMTAAMTLKESGGETLGTTLLGSVTSPSQGSRVAASRHTSGGSVVCQTTTGEGCVHGGATREIGAVSVAGLPPKIITSGSAPAGWGDATANYLFKLEDYSDRVQVESGVDAAGPSAQVPAVSGGTVPQLTYWNGSGYSTIPVNWGASAPTIAIPSFTVTDTSLAGGDVSVSVSAQITTAATSTASTGPTGCSTVCTATASAPSPVTATVVYTVKQGGITLADLLLNFDLGTMLARTSYKAAPSAG
ncbi:MAG TPA: hypothetical protein VNA57_06470 [Acidimicrobiales bacterium]|nr:hypothetical protein [Acidimicrobiales bacterium]